MDLFDPVALTATASAVYVADKGGAVVKPDGSTFPVMYADPHGGPTAITHDAACVYFVDDQGFACSLPQ